MTRTPSRTPKSQTEKVQAAKDQAAKDQAAKDQAAKAAPLPDAPKPHTPREQVIEIGAEPLTVRFMQRVLFVMLAVACAFLAYKLLSLWLLIFGAILIATVLRALAEPLMKYARFPAPAAVLTVFVAVLVFVGVTFYLFGRELVEQAQMVSAQLPAAWASLQVRLQATDIGRAVQGQIGALGKDAGGALSNLPVIASNVAASLAELLVASIAGITLAIRPGRYRNGLVMLFPTKHHARLRNGMNAAGRALRGWFTAQFIAMVIVGTLIGVLLSLAGVKSALALGLLAGIAQFVPLVGQVVSAGCGLLLASVYGWQTMAWTLAIYVGVSQLEANLISPFVQRRVNDIPIVLSLFAVIGFAGLLGPIGVLYAMPITVVLYTLVRKIYLENHHDSETS
ncbi:MAG: AI-2E family transporter [Asticcacaulis sp.]